MKTEEFKGLKRFKGLKDFKLTLASSSPRRKQILRREGFKFKVLIPGHVEVKDISSDPVTHVLKLSKEKAESVLDKVKGGLILGADTIVVLDGEILGKPKDEDEAFSILNRLSGKTHQVYTGITLIHKETGENKSDYDCTKVKFNRLKKEEILDYIATGEPMDKAGAYGIQGMGNFLVEDIQGELDNVIGLPVRVLKKLLVEFNSG